MAQGQPEDVVVGSAGGMELVVLDRGIPRDAGRIHGLVVLSG